MTLAHIARAVRVNDDMIRRRDNVRALFAPERYAAETAKCRRLIRFVMERDGLQALGAALKLCQDALEKGHGGAVNVLIAAVVDMIEGGN
jgi:hypothetical protein